MPQTSPCKEEYILNPIYHWKDKDIKKVNKLNTAYKKEITYTKKTPYNVHDPELEVEVADKSTSRKWYLKSFTCAIAIGVLFSWNLILIDSSAI